jgi:hypothetical protein
LCFTCAIYAMNNTINIAAYMKIVFARKTSINTLIIALRANNGNIQYTLPGLKW